MVLDPNEFTEVKQADATYVYDNVEVVKTGRTATKKLKSGKLNELLEIMPKDPNVGTWKKWVRDIDLYEVTT